MAGGDHDRRMDPSACWLTETWPLVVGGLPAPPARVVELGCGPDGGFVPALLAAGYDAVGVDPRAPEDAPYVRADFEQAELGPPAGAVVACVSLHHVGDLDLVLDRVVQTLAPSGTIVVVEWAWERFDDATARWCFDRLAPPAPDAHAGWLARHRQRWEQSGLPWTTYIERWAADEGLHAAVDIVRGLDQRFTRTRLDDVPYFFCDLVGADRAAEQAAVAAGEIRPTGLHYVGTTASHPQPVMETT
jgi:SAM-dependent methyltransferase